MALSRLKPETSVMVAALTSLGVIAIFTGAVPNFTDIRATEPHDDTVEKQRKNAAIAAVALVVGVSALSRDLGPYVIGGTVLVGMDYMIKHANSVNPATNKMDTDQGAQSLYSLPTSYEETAESQ